jgi:hypothetical protein
LSGGDAEYSTLRLMGVALSQSGPLGVIPPLGALPPDAADDDESPADTELLGAMDDELDGKHGPILSLSEMLTGPQSMSTLLKTRYMGEHVDEASAA